MSSALQSLPLRPIADAGVLLSERDIFRLSVAILADEIAARTKRSVPAKTYRAWTRDTPMDEEDIGLDSLARLDAAIRFNRFFHLHEVGIEDYLLLEETLGGWCDIVGKSLAIKSERIGFQTSGSTGTSKTCDHELASLCKEAEAQAALLPVIKRIVSFIPPHHIFGFLTTILLPRTMDVPVIDARSWGPGAWNTKIDDGDLLVATPFLWGVLSRGVRRFPETVTGLTSTAPMPEALTRSLIAQGLSDMIEFYGSSETAGIGYRWSCDAHFQLFSHLERRDETIVYDDRLLSLQDKLEWFSDRTFLPRGRLDDVVQVGGVNVPVSRVRDVILQHALIADCAVRLQHAQDGRDRLAAFLVPSRHDQSTGEIVAALTDHCRSNLNAVERPVEFTVGSKLPVNDMGKVTAW